LNSLGKVKTRFTGLRLLYTLYFSVKYGILCVN
jgi:hypothetical protein